MEGDNVTLDLYLNYIHMTPPNLIIYQNLHLITLDFDNTN